MASPDETPEAGRSVTAKVLALLAGFTPAAPELSLSELARRAEVPLPTAHRRVAELVQWGALERTPEGRYRIGARLSELASPSARGIGLREVAMPYLEDLYEITSENVQLAVRQGTELVFVERIAGRHAVPLYSRFGDRFALHATGVGLVLLAHAPAEIQEEILDGPLPYFSAKTITDPAVLRSELGAIRRSGFAVSDGQIAVDALSVAAPITSEDGTVIAAVSLVIRTGSADPKTLAPAVQTAARAISRALPTQHHSEPVSEDSRSGTSTQ